MSSEGVIAVHLIMTVYGHWGVNDTRGSGSTEVYDAKAEDRGRFIWDASACNRREQR